MHQNRWSTKILPVPVVKFSCLFIARAGWKLLKKLEKKLGYFSGPGIFCGPGTRINSDNICVLCPKNSYNNRERHTMTDCIPCGRGFHTKQEGSSSFTQCLGRHLRETSSPCTSFSELVEICMFLLSLSILTSNGEDKIKSFLFLLQLYLSVSQVLKLMNSHQNAHLAQMGDFSHAQRVTPCMDRWEKWLFHLDQWRYRNSSHLVSLLDLDLPSSFRTSAVDVPQPNLSLEDWEPLLSLSAVRSSSALLLGYAQILLLLEWKDIWICIF